MRYLTSLTILLSTCLATVSVAGTQYDLQQRYWGSIGFFEPLEYYVVAIDVAPNGRVHALDLFHDYIRIYEPDGTIVNEFPHQDRWPRGIAADADGNTYVADANFPGVRKYSADGELVLAFGGEGSDPGEFDYPRAIDINSEGLILVADRRTQLTAFDSDGNVVWNNAATVVPEGEMPGPQGLVVDEQDNIFVIDTTLGKVMVFDPEGVYQRSWGPSGEGWDFGSPVSITIGQNGHIYVLDRLQKLIHVGLDMIKEFDADGQYLGSFGVKGRGPFNLWEPQGIATGPDGSIWVAGFQGHNIVRYDEDGNGIDEWNDHTPTPYEFAQARSAAVGLDGRVYAIDFWNHLVQVFDRFGTFEEMWGERGQGDGQVFNFPKQTTTDSDGNLYVSDDGWMRKFAPDGTFLARFGSHPFPGGLEVDTQGNTWVTVTGDPSIVRYTPSLNIDLTIRPDDIPDGFGPNNIRQAPNGMMYFADVTNHRIIRMDTSGNFDMSWGQFGTDPGEFRAPVGMAIDSQNRVYVSETWSKRLQVFDADGALLDGWDLPGVPGMEPSRVFNLTMDGDYFIYAPDFTFGQAQIHKYALVPDADLAGEPAIAPGALQSWIWSEDGRLWHLRWQADGIAREFGGRVHNTGGIYQSFAPASTDVAATVIRSSGDLTTFSASHDTGVSGVDIVVADEGIITFEFEIDGEPVPGAMTVGAGQFVPTTLPVPFDAVGGLTLIDPFGKPDYSVGEDLGFFVWRDSDDGHWRLRWSGDGVVNTGFSGTVSSSRGFDSVSTFSFEAAEDEFLLDGDVVSFSAVAGAGEDGLLLGVPDGATLSFDLDIDGGDDAQSIAIGSTGAHPDSASFLMITIRPTVDEDLDGDGIQDALDNCITVANISQCDSDQDGFGNLCDADVDQSGRVDFGDLAQLGAAFLTGVGEPAYDADLDLNCDDVINFLDLQAFERLFFLPPGPSGTTP